ncbi:30S ribosomal subunit protein S6 [Candidatus Hodgkinia cicadicola]|nr:30S ribosomal subunit protein S6 [Candidatus Hodgkinia cicadicola]
MQNKIYELIIFLKLGEPNLTAEVASDYLKTLLSAAGAKNVVCTVWDRANLAYKIQGQRTVLGLHLDFKLDEHSHLQQIENSARKRLKPLRFCLTVSNSFRAAIKPSFYKVVN